MSTTPWDDYGSLDSYGGGDFAPEHKFAASTETLTDGDYDCEVVAAVLEKTVNGSLICKATLRVTPAGGKQGEVARLVEHTYWLNRQPGVNAFCAEMAQLGFPAHQWGSGPGRIPLSQAVPAAVARLKGLRFRATKTSRQQKPVAPNQPAMTYHDLRIHGKLPPASASPMPPVTEPAAPPPAAPPTYDPDQDDGSIPFSLAPFLFALLAAGAECFLA